VRQTELRTDKPFVPEPSCFEVEIIIENLKRYKSPGINQILADMVQAEGKKLRSEIHKRIDSVWKKEELLKPSTKLYLFIQRAINLIPFQLSFRIFRHDGPRK
jgi:hypothetical protein